MTMLSKVPRDTTPKRIVVLGPDAFADDWSGKPTDEVAIGLRFVSQADVDAATREAERVATGFYDELPRSPDPEILLDIRNDALLMGLVARGTCNPNDVMRPYFMAADDTVKIALTSQGARRIWDEMVLLALGTGVARRRVSDEEGQKLGRLLAQGVLLTDEHRMLLAYIADAIGLDATQEQPDGDDETRGHASDDEETAVYTARRSA